MATRDHPPMAGGSTEHHEVICIEAKKVFDFCFQEHRVERTFANLVVPAGDSVKVKCRILANEATCREVERREVDGKKGKFLICLAVEVPVLITVNNESFERTITFLKQVVLFAPAGTQIQCEVTGNCCCFFNQEQGQVECAFDLCLVISSKATVRVLVPIVGFCAPKECTGIGGGCPPMVPKDHDKDC